MSAPVHVVADSASHGVGRYAREVAGEVGAATMSLARARTMPPSRVHLHLADSALATTCEEAADVAVALARRHDLTLTLHDVPQPEDGAVFARRAAAYSRVLAAAGGWVANSRHEDGLARRHLGAPAAGAVVPLPLVRRPRAPRPARPADREGTVVGVLGWVYPGKGHAEVLEACGDLRRREGGSVTVRALGAVAARHRPLADELHALAERHGVGLEVAGWLAEDELDREVALVDVPVSAHRKVSASGSLNSWVAAGRRPLVLDGPYARETAALRPGTLHLVAPGPAALTAALARAQADPGATWLPPGADVPWTLRDVGAAYRRWWATT